MLFACLTSESNIFTSFSLSLSLSSSDFPNVKRSRDISSNSSSSVAVELQKIVRFLSTLTQHAFLQIYLRFLKLFIDNFCRQLQTIAVDSLPFLHTFVPTYAAFPNPSSVVVSRGTFSNILRSAA